MTMGPMQRNTQQQISEIPIRTIARGINRKQYAQLEVGEEEEEELSVGQVVLVVIVAL